MATTATPLRPNEQAFLEQVMELSREEVQLGKLGLAQAASSDVRSFAQQLAADQQQIVNSIEALRQKKGVVEPALAPTGASSAAQQIAQRSGADFDRAFMQRIATTQHQTLRLFQNAVADAKDPDVRDFAGSYLPMLRAHRNRITELTEVVE